MRALMVLITLLATPFVATVAQADQAAQAREHGCEMRDAKITNLTARERALQKCVLVPSPPAEDPPPSEESPGWGGTSVIDGLVFRSDDPFWPGLSGWTVSISGAVGASMQTDAAGQYAFSTLPPGSYTVCLTVPSSWTPTFPPSGTQCSTGYGYTFELFEGIGASFVNFGAAPQ